MIDKETLKKWNKKYLKSIKEYFKPTEKQLYLLEDLTSANYEKHTKFECAEIIGLAARKYNRGDIDD